jgi:hypothetical protein
MSEVARELWSLARAYLKEEPDIMDIYARMMRNSKIWELANSSERRGVKHNG